MNVHEDRDSRSYKTNRKIIKLEARVYKLKWRRKIEKIGRSIAFPHLHNNIMRREELDFVGTNYLVTT